MEIEDIIRAQFPSIKVNNKDNFKIFKFSHQGISFKLKPNSYLDQGFENFAIVESCKTLEIKDLFNLDEEVLQSKYNKNMEEDIGGFFVYTKPSCKKYKIRTVIHCLDENLAEMFQELSTVHLKIHLDTLAELGL